MVGCGHHSEVGAGKKHVWKHVEPPHPKPAPPASVTLNLLSGWPRPHWQSGIKTAGKKKMKGRRKEASSATTLHVQAQIGKSVVLGQHSGASVTSQDSVI